MLDQVQDVKTAMAELGRRAPAVAPGLARRVVAHAPDRRAEGKVELRAAGVGRAARRVGAEPQPVLLAAEQRPDNSAGGTGTIRVRGLVADGRANHPADDHSAEIAVVIVAACGRLAIDRYLSGLAELLVRGGLADIASADRVGLCHRAEDGFNSCFGSRGDNGDGTCREGGDNRGCESPRGEETRHGMPPIGEIDCGLVLNANSYQNVADRARLSFIRQIVAFTPPSYCQKAGGFPFLPRR